MKLCIVIPAYNEEKAISITINEYRKVFPEASIVVIDNNSDDDTSKEASSALSLDKDLLLTEFQQGKGYSVKTGLARLDSDIYIMTDGDATYPAEDARRMVDEMLKSRVDMLVGDRISGGGYAAQNSRIGHNLGNVFLTFVISKLTGKKYIDVLSGLRVMSRPFVSALDIRSSGFQLETEINVIAAYLRADVIETPISYRARPDESSSKLNTIKDGFKILGFALTNWIAFAPLQPFLLTAGIMILVSVLLGYRVIAGYLETGWPYTTTALGAAAFAIVAVLALFFGISLRILGRNDRRREIARFLEAKRVWNSRLDAKDI